MTVWAGMAWAQAQPPVVPEAPITTFGVTVYDSLGLQGKIYLLDPGTDALPKFEKLEPVGTIYTTALNIPPRDFMSGFPGITDRFEWFAIDYTGEFWVSQAGTYRFLLASDDGSKLYIDGKQIINNDGIHAIQTETGSAKLKVGSHRIRVSYFQGPRAHLALMLGVAREKEDQFRVFNMRDFRPPRTEEKK